MNNKFNILWLDDEFIYEEGSVNLPLPLIRMRFPTLDIETVAFVDHCEEKLKSKDKSYQAVILDANGKYSNTPNQEANKIGFEELIELAQTLQTPVYVFSGELSPEKAGDLADITLRYLRRKGFTENTNLFYKGQTYPRLLNKIKEDLENNYHIFYNYPTILDNVLNYGVNKESARDLLLWMEDKSRPFPEYIALRRIIYDEIDKKFKKIFGGSVDYKFITEKCMTEWEKGIISWLFKNTINAEVHHWPSNDMHSQEIIAHSFITLMNWYNRFIHNMEKDSDLHKYYTKAKSNSDNSSQESDSNIFTSNAGINDNEPYIGYIEKDQNGFYHVGSYILKNQWAEKNIGKKIKVTGERHHPYKNLCYKSEFIE